jgi:hypothetical protein
MLAANKIENVIRRVNRARRFPVNTCPASRHVYIVAKNLLLGWPVDPNEYEHIAGSLLSVLESLWKSRTRLEKLDPCYGRVRVGRGKEDRS